MRLWYSSISSLSVLVTLAAGWAGPLPWQDPRNLPVFTSVIVLVWMVGLLLAAFPGALVMGPLLHSRGIKNGAPFEIGDQVQVLWGPYRGKLGLIRSVAQNGGLNLELIDDDQVLQSLTCPPEQLLKQSFPNR